MTFPSSTGILLPGDFNVVRRIYSEIASEEWFTTSPERREQFAITVIDAYRQGLHDPDELAERCRTVAREQYGNAGIVEIRT